MVNKINGFILCDYDILRYFIYYALKGERGMPEKIIITSNRAPAPKGPYSQAIVYQGILYVSGQIPIDPQSGELKRGTIQEETEIVLNNLKAIVEDAGAKIDDVIKITCYLTDIKDFVGFNSVYENFFSNSPPARTTVQVAGLPLGVKIEIDAIVGMPQD